MTHVLHGVLELFHLHLHGVPVMRNSLLLLISFPVFIIVYIDLHYVPIMSPWTCMTGSRFSPPSLAISLGCMLLCVLLCHTIYTIYPNTATSTNTMSSRTGRTAPGRASWLYRCAGPPHWNAGYFDRYFIFFQVSFHLPTQNLGDQAN